VPTEISSYNRNRRSFLKRQARLLGDGYGLALGDSHIEGLAFVQVDPLSLNAGIGTDTSLGVLERLSDYEPLDRWRYIVLAIGFNDLRFREPASIKDNIDAILRRIGTRTTVYLAAIMPVEESAMSRHHGRDNASITAANKLLREMTSRLNGVQYIDLYSLLADENGSLPSHLHIGDGVHLNPDGRELVLNRLKSAITQTPASDLE